MYLIGVFGSLLLLIIAGFHWYWLFGGKVGTDRYINLGKDGERIRIPKPLILVTSFVFLGAGLLPLVSLGIIPIPLPRQLIDAALIMGICVFILRGTAGLVWSLAQPEPRDIFHRWNIGLYTWVCLALALSYGACLLA
ncbi:MAG: DUF3995 domain-containing protein [Coriobacteriales bacterium]|jgi:hypothetical protein|nr:DUF3995 domain-containing protein [Coriobacteriales bacterium]